MLTAGYIGFRRSARLIEKARLGEGLSQTGFRA